MMWKLLIGSLTALVVMYCTKILLLHVAVPAGSMLGVDDEDLELTARSGRNASDWMALARSLNPDNDQAVLSQLLTCVEGQGTERAACQTVLAEMHLVGASVPQDFRNASELLQKAADDGDVDAQYNLAMLYTASIESGQDPRRQEALAVLHLYAASTAGHPGALMAMGYRHMHGYGVPKACTTAALNYIEVAKKIAGVYSAGMPQAVELIRLNLHQKDRKAISSSEMNLFVQIASNGDTTVAAAIGKRYLLGIEGFRQDYHKAKRYLRLAADRNHPNALALLGYMYSLGLGTTQNLDMAYSYFVSASAQHDPLGNNGLGYIYFRGTTQVSRNLKLAFKHFNESAYGGNSDGMFNLASMYLTGTGVDQSFQKAVLWYTQALDRGHTPAAYSLAVMHLNGIGTVRNCDIAVNLLKKVCERGEWVTSKLVDAYEYGENYPDRAAFLFLKLAEAGHEVAQMNVAHLLDSGGSFLLYRGDERSGVGPTDDMRQHSRTVAQRYYEMSAEQGSASSELRLGDYAYYGWGITARYKDEWNTTDPDPEDDDSFPAMFASSEPELEVRPQVVDYEASLARYRRTAETPVTGEWMQAFVARGSFNLGYMHQFGLGVSQDLHLAKRHYQRCQEVDPAGVHAPVSIVLFSLSVQMYLLQLPPLDVFMSRLSSDLRVHILMLHIIALVLLLIVRVSFSGPRARARLRARPALSQRSQPDSIPSAPSSRSSAPAAEEGGDETRAPAAEPPAPAAAPAAAGADHFILH